MSGTLSLQFNARAQSDLQRITHQLTDLQGQVASSKIARDMEGFGGGASRILNARTLQASSDARNSVVGQLLARFGVQSASLGQVADSATGLAQSIREAISSNDGRGVSDTLASSFSSIVSALNETWQGQPMFAGERQDGKPVKIDTLAQLQAATGPSDIFDEATRQQTVDLGNGPPIVVAQKASDMSQGLFDTLRDLATLVTNSGGQIGQPISDAQRASLQNIADRLDVQSNNFNNEEGRTGQLQARLEDEQTRLTAQSDLLTKQIGDQTDVDIGAVSMQLNALMVQYQAAAKTFSDLSQLSLLNFLPAA